jgi:hypothetical protein
MFLNNIFASFPKSQGDGILVCLFASWCLMPLSTIFQLYHGGQIYWWGNLSQVTDKQNFISHNVVHLP